MTLADPRAPTLIQIIGVPTVLVGRVAWVERFRYFFTNNALWPVQLTAFTVGFDMLFAVLFDRVKYEATAKSIIFLPWVRKEQFHA